MAEHLDDNLQESTHPVVEIVVQPKQELPFATSIGYPSFIRGNN